jgi:hypothetical protein
MAGGPAMETPRDAVASRTLNAEPKELTMILRKATLGSLLAPKGRASGSSMSQETGAYQ